MSLEQHYETGSFKKKSNEQVTDHHEETGGLQPDPVRIGQTEQLDQADQRQHIKEAIDQIVGQTGSSFEQPTKAKPERIYGQDEINEQWIVLCQQMLNQIWEHFRTKQRDRNLIEKIQHYFGWDKQFESEMKEITALGQLDREGKRGQVSIFPGPLAGELEALFNQGVTDVRDVMIRSSQVRKMFETPEIKQFAFKELQNKG